MGQLLHGKWVEQDGYTPGAHDNNLDTKYFPFNTSEKNRYHLYIGNSCPYAHRALIALYLNNLQDYIGVSFVAPANTEVGWTFHSNDYKKVKDNALNKNLLHEVYTAADSKYSGRVTIPLLVDLHPTGPKGGDGEIRIVTNESYRIVNTFFALGNKLQTTEISSREPDYEIDSLSASFGNIIYGSVGVRNQTEYDLASDTIYEALDELNTHLKTNKYLAGDKISNADIIFFPFIARFDVAFTQLIYFTRARVTDFKYLYAYFLRLYNHPKIKNTVFVDEIRDGMMAPLYRQKFKIPFEIIPARPYLEWIDN